MERTTLSTYGSFSVARARRGGGPIYSADASQTHYAMYAHVSSITILPSKERAIQEGFVVVALYSVA